MKHVVMTGPRQSSICEISAPVPGDSQVLIKLKYVGVCMSEHDAWAAASPGDAFGHEPLGTIMRVGKNVTGYAVGERVSGLWGGTLPGAGGMVEYAVATPECDTIVKVPEGFRDEDFILEPLSCLMSAVSKTRTSMPGTTVAIVGCGYMGCGALSLLKACGCRIVAIDIRKECLQDALRFGADEIYLAEEAQSHFADNPDFPGFDVVMEWGETSEALNLAIGLTRQCGQLCVGAYHTGGNRHIDMQQLNIKAIECLSVHPREAGLNQTGAINAAGLLKSGMWKFLNVPVKIYPYTQFDLAQAELKTKYGSYMKALINMERDDFAPYILA